MHIHQQLNCTTRKHLPSKLPHVPSLKHRHRGQVLNKPLLLLKGWILMLLREKEFKFLDSAQTKFHLDEVYLELPDLDKKIS